MSTPFQRLRMVIDKVGVDTFQTTKISVQHHHIQQTQQPEVYECHRYIVSHNHQKPLKSSSHKPSLQTEYYTKEDLLKIRTLYQQQKEKCNQLRFENQKLKQQIGLKEENISELNRTWTEKNREWQEMRGRGELGVSQKYERVIGEKQRVYKGEIEKLNQILDQLNRELNMVRQKYKVLEEESGDKINNLTKQNQHLRIQISNRLKQIKQLQHNIQQRKKLIEFNLQSHQQSLFSLQKKHEAKSQQLLTTITTLEKQIEDLNLVITSHNEKHHESKSIIFNHENSISKFKQAADNSLLNHKRNIEQQEQKINTLLKTIEGYQGVERRNQELERLIEDEKAKEKYHIVEVRDETIELEVQMLRGQVKELLKGKAIAEERLRKSCNCVRTTLVMKDESGASIGMGETMKYMQGHEIKILRQ